MIHQLHPAQEVFHVEDPTEAPAGLRWKAGGKVMGCIGAGLTGGVVIYDAIGEIYSICVWRK